MTVFRKKQLALVTQQCRRLTNLNYSFLISVQEGGEGRESATSVRIEGMTVDATSTGMDLTISSPRISIFFFVGLVIRVAIKPVLRIRGMLVWIRIRGSVPPTNGSGSWNFCWNSSECSSSQFKFLTIGCRVRIQDVYSVSRIPDPGSKDSGSLICIRIKEF